MSRYSPSVDSLRTPVALATFALLLALFGCSRRDQPDVAASTPAASATDAAAPAAPAASKVAAATATPPAAVANPGLVLTELLYRPAEGTVPFIEIENVGREPAALKPLTLLIDTEAVPLGEMGEKLAPGARLLVVLDGPQRMEGSAYHVGEEIRMAADAGRLAIMDPYGNVVDDVAWGSAPGAVNPVPGGVRGQVQPGESIGRPPGATRPRSALAWIGYAAADISPGKANPPAAVHSTHPLSGVITNRSGAQLSWFPVPGAAAYVVQVATDESFATVVLERSTTEPRLDVSSLASGRYLWRVQSKGESGAVAAWSAVFAVTLADTPGVVTPPEAHAANRWQSFGSRGLELFMPTAQAQVPTGPALSVYRCPQNSVAPLQEACVVLAVPPISQHKDTRMLLLEHPFRTGTHAWDVDHGDLHEGDPSDYGNCGLAAIAMMNRYASGDLSQDRIGFEVLQGLAAGPETDLMYGQGMSDPEARKAYQFALGVSPTVKQRGDLDNFWGNAVSEIDAGRPMLAQNDDHFILVVGYYRSNGERVLVINDPWTGRQHHARFDDLQAIQTLLGFYQYVALQPFRARHQEASVTQDGDGDGVVDFDETERFHTNPGNNDTDADGVNDKNDIAASVFDATYGYAIHKTGRDEDHDGRPMELDRDSDDGGCKDGDEDRNGNGDYEGSVVQQVETWNFKFIDDSCKGLAGHVTRRFRQSGITTPIIEWSEGENWSGINVRLKPVDGEPGYYEDDGSRYQYAGTGFVRYIVGECRIDVRSWANSSGDFLGGAAAPATAQINDDGRLAMHFVAGVPDKHTGASMFVSPAACRSSGLGGSGYSSNPPSAEFPDECWGDPVRPGQPGYVPGLKVFHFNCHTQYLDATGTVAVP